MIETSSCPATSNASRINPTRPSIISLGPMISIPQSACATAIFAKISKVLSFTIFPFSTKPSCPSLLYGSIATSVIMQASGNFFLINAKVFKYKPFLLVLSVANLSLYLSVKLGNTSKVVIPNFKHCSISFSIKSGLNLKMPGIDFTSDLLFFPSIKNSGKIKSLTVT